MLMLQKRYISQILSIHLSPTEFRNICGIFSKTFFCFVFFAADICYHTTQKQLTHLHTSVFMFPILPSILRMCPAPSYVVFYHLKIVMLPISFWVEINQDTGGKKKM